MKLLSYCATLNIHRVRYLEWGLFTIFSGKTLCVCPVYFFFLFSPDILFLHCIFVLMSVTIRNFIYNIGQCKRFWTQTFWIERFNFPCKRYLRKLCSSCYDYSFTTVNINDKRRQISKICPQDFDKNFDRNDAKTLLEG